jgi:ATP-dependent Clp protease ATP-binding subunit ClpC
VSVSLSIAGTRSSQAAAIRSLVFGWMGWSVAAALILFSGGVLLYADDAAPLVLSLISIFFTIHVVSLFLKEYLESSRSVSTGAPAGELLSPHLLRHVRGTEVNGLDLLNAALASDRGKFLIGEMGLEASNVLSTCGTEMENADVPSLVQTAAEMLPSLNEAHVDASVLLAAILLHTESGKTLLSQADLSQEDMTGMLHWESFRNNFCLHENVWSSSAIRRSASLGRSWVMGYTDALDSLTSEIDTTEHTCGESSVIIHQDLIDRAVRILAKSERKNMLLLGNIGTGRRTLVRNIAAGYRSLQRDQHLPFTRVLLLHMEKLMSGTQNPDAFLFSALSRASSGGTFILVIPDFSQLLKSADENLKTVLLKCLQSTSFGIIGIAETQDYHSFIKNDASLDHLLEKIDVSDASDDETMQVLMAHWCAARNHNVQLTYKAMRSIIALSRRYLSPNTGMPGKAIIVMDEAVQRAKEHGDVYLTEAHVREVISVRGKVNVQKVGEEERERLINLESVLAEHVIDQPNAIHAVSGALKRARIDLGERNRPIGTFLFLGPTGVGKTQTAKTLAQEYFGSADAMIRLDMNEYSHPDSVFAITGAASGADGFLAQRVQDRPFSLILLDEIEKAHPSILNLFLQILDEGFLNDARGVRTDFRNTIIIATSNAGALFIRDYVRDHSEIDKNAFKKELLDVILRDQIFSPEFVNRFDEVVLFYPLTQEGVERVAVLMLDEIINDIKKKRGIDIRLEADVVGGLVERGHSIEFGAREMRRTITGIIEDYLADYMLTHDVKRGETITIRTQDLKW